MTRRTTLLRIVVGTAAVAAVVSGAVAVGSPTAIAQENNAAGTPQMAPAQELSYDVTVKADAEKYELTYPAASGKKGTTVEVAPDTAAPEGTAFQFTATVPEGVSINEETGVITAAIPDEDDIRGIKLPVRATYTGGTSEAMVIITVTRSLDLGSLGGQSSADLFGTLGS